MMKRARDKMRKIQRWHLLLLLLLLLFLLLLLLLFVPSLKFCKFTPSDYICSKKDKR